jgi:AAA+ superfamily predicted ATPase
MMNQEQQILAKGMEAKGWQHNKPAPTNSEKLQANLVNFTNFFFDLVSFKPQTCTPMVAYKFDRLFVAYKEAPEQERAAVYATIKHFYDTQIKGNTGNMIRFKIWLQTVLNDKVLDAILYFMTNYPNISPSLAFLRATITARLQTHFQNTPTIPPAVPVIFQDNSPFAQFIQTQQPNTAEFTLLLLALAPHLQPDFFTHLIAEHLPQGGDFPEFGGVKATNHRGILPTGETAQFVLAGDDLEKRLEIQRLLSPDHWFSEKHILWLEPVREGEPMMSGRLILDPEIVEQLTTGTVSKPRFSMDFPAEYIETDMEWSDLVLHPNTLRQIHEIEHWITHSNTLLEDWGMKKRIKPGYRALFYGSSGTGKTLTATLLGKYTHKEVFRIDLSRVVSKYIGETEKNLSKLFDKAENKNWILFFDEADALFGKRTGIRDAHDKYANQEVAYLLQRVEGYNGLVILCTNQRTNIDEAFTRRFQTIIHFPMPRAEERLAIWQKAFPPQMEMGPNINLHQIAARYELTGASILNVVHYCAIEALAAGSLTIDLKHLEEGIMREFVKEGKVV